MAQGHWFEFETDQTYLPPVISQLRALIEAFPVRDRARRCVLEAAGAVQRHRRWPFSRPLDNEEEINMSECEKHASQRTTPVRLQDISLGVGPNHNHQLDCHYCAAL